MRKTGLLVGFLLISVIGTHAAAQEAAAEAEPEKKICRTERMTGSRTRVTRICRTQAEWTAISQAARKQVDDVVGMSGRTDRPAGMARDPSGGMTSGPPGIP